MFNEEIFIRLGVALVLGMIIGFERIYNGHDAGMRTHGILSMGACLFIMVAIFSAKEFSIGDSEIIRTIGQIITGVGFLCGGLIFMSNKDNHKKGLTSAATLWATSAIGAACGFGYLGLAGIATAFIFFTLTLLGKIEWGMLRILGKYDAKKQK